MCVRLDAGLVEWRIWCASGFQPGGFGYNEGPTSSCQTFCWKARLLFGRAFFLSLTRLPRSLVKRVNVQYCLSANVYNRHIRNAIAVRPDLLIIDRLDEESAPAIFEAAQAGLRILTQMDSILSGIEIPQQLMALGIDEQQLARQLGGSIGEPEYPGPGFVVCNGMDPEGNLFQVRETRTVPA